MHKKRDIPFTICFCIQEDNVLLIYRNNPPNKNKWNGIGGKIDQREDFNDAAKREIFEEAGISVQTNQLIYVGIVSWNEVQDSTNYNKGMHAFIVHLPKSLKHWKEKDTREGLLAWKSLDWVCDTGNKEVVDNIPQFLPLMLKTKKPLEYFCEYREKKFVKLIVKNL